MRRITLLVGVVCLIASIVVVGSALADGGGQSRSSDPVHKSLPLRAEQAGKPFTVKIKVLQKKGETLALIPVTAHGEQLLFIVDTGAARSNLNTDTAESLGLEKVGPPKTVAGVGCTSKSQPVKIDNWSIAGHDLPAVLAVSSEIALTKGSNVVGLLGSDVWSKFGSIKIDYANETMTVG